MKYVLLCSLILLYVFITWNVQEGFRNARTYYVYETQDWDDIKEEVAELIDDTTKDRYVVLYLDIPIESSIKKYLQETSDPKDEGVKIMIAISSAVSRNDTLTKDIVSSLHPESEDETQGIKVYTFKKDSTSSTTTIIPSDSVYGNEETTETTTETTKSNKSNGNKKGNKKGKK